MVRLTIWPKRVGWGLVYLVAAAAIGFATVNAVSYFRYRQAWNIGDRLTRDELREMAVACAEFEKQGYESRRAEAIPAPFRKLNARSATFAPGYSDFDLYSAGQISVWIRISTSEQDQEICVYDNLRVPQGSRVLWRKNPAFAEQRNPTGRLVTLTEYRMHGARDWIVLPNEIRVIDREYTVGSADAVAAVVPLAKTDRQKILAAIAAIPAGIRGREYTSGAEDGIGLHIGFSGDGKLRAADDIRLSNTWRDEVEPLIECVSSCLSAENAIRFKSKVTQEPFFDPKNQSSLTWTEMTARERRWMPLPWWCVWPRFIGG